jgi:peptide chain release factor
MVQVRNECFNRSRSLTLFSSGGQAIATTNNCVVLKHKPTNIIVKCHETRSLQQNRQAARRIMITKLDNHLNHEDSVENQRKRLEQSKHKKAQSKSEKLRKLKLEFKESNKTD